MSKSRRKIDRVKLVDMLRRGKTPAQCAEHFGVSEAAICLARKEINVGVVKNVAMENAARVVEKHLNTVDQMQKINKHTNELLDLLTKWMNGDPSVKETLVRQWFAENKMNMRIQDPRKMMLEAVAEIRNQLRLQLEIYQSLYDMQAVQEFQKEVLQTIGEVSKEVRDEIICRLTEKSALRRAISVD